MWYVDENVTAKSYGAEVVIACTTNRIENEQGWKDIQFVSTATLLMTLLTICKFVIRNMYGKKKFASLSLSLSLSLSGMCACTLLWPELVLQRSAWNSTTS